MLKTLLFHHPNGPLHLHIFCTNETRLIWHTLLDTWELQQVAASYLIVQVHENNFLQYFCGMKMQNLNQIIMIDEHVRFVSDVSLLFMYFTNNKTFYMDENLHVTKNMSFAHNGDVIYISASETDFAFKTHDQMIVQSNIETVKGILESNADTFGHHQRTKCKIEGGHTIKTISVIEDECVEFRIAAQLKRRTHLYYLGTKTQPSNEVDVTLMTQFSPDRLAMLLRMLKMWEGPVQAVVHGTDEQIEQIESQLLEIVGYRTNVAIHVVYKRLDNYPVNYLRNIAMNETSTTFSFLLDVDFIPCPNAYTLAKDNIKRYMVNDEVKKVLVIPALQVYESKDNYLVPKSHIIELYKEGKVHGFRLKEGWHFGHGPTNIKKWMHANSSYKVKYQAGYEPYIITSNRGDQIRMDERLLDRMGNKIQLEVEYYKKGYKFEVVPNMYVMHFPHQPSFGKRRLKDPIFKRCSGILYNEFLDDLKSRTS